MTPSTTTQLVCSASRLSSYSYTTATRRIEKQVPRFSYSIQRPYPYPWFTWVTAIGGIISALLISIFNLGSEGYYLEAVYTNDRNGTLAQEQWFTKAPFSWTMRDQVVSFSNYLS